MLPDALDKNIPYRVLKQGRAFGAPKSVIERLQVGDIAADFSGLAGAVVSSTAVVAAFARRAASGEAVRPLSGGAILAAMVSALRVLIIVTLVKPEVGLAIAAPAITTALIFGAIGALLLYRDAQSVAECA